MDRLTSITEAQFAEAGATGEALARSQPSAVMARYDRSLAKIVVELSNGVTLMFKPQLAEGLEHAKPTQLARIVISPSGFGFHFPALDVDLYLPGLLQGFFGSTRWHAAQLGRAGGRATTSAKAAAARQNGKLGGRPRKKAVPLPTATRRAVSDP